MYLKFDDAAEGHLPVKSKEIDPNQTKTLSLTDAQFVAKNPKKSSNFKIKKLFLPKVEKMEKGKLFLNFQNIRKITFTTNWASKYN